MKTETTNLVDQFQWLPTLLESLGDISPSRVRFHPLPGSATEEDLLASDDGSRPFCELLDGVLVEKAFGFYESTIAGLIPFYLRRYLDQNDLGVVAGAGGPVRFRPGLVRLPDVSFVLWSRLPGEQLSRDPILPMAPDLAVEVWKRGNTEREIARKLREFLSAGTRLGWVVEPELHRVRVYHSPDKFQLLTYDDALDGGDVLPGFSLSLKEFFDEAEAGPP